MLGATRSLLDRANDFSRYSDSELIAELGRLADELGIKMTFTIATDEKCPCQLDALLASAFLTEVACYSALPARIRADHQTMRSQAALPKACIEAGRRSTRLNCLNRSVALKNATPDDLAVGS